ncbi:hypothetical protein EON65_04330 [archaeon]|nr:MAG: hypothetical protein EON65_04330 [archaeon]
MLKSSSADERWQGTIVTVCGLFARYKVRQKSMQSSTERYRIVEFVKKMSILHHHITWKVTDQGQTLLQLTGCLSVSKRLISLHGVAILNNLSKVTYQEGNLTLQGLLSPPSPEACHWTKDMQYSYLNHRYCRNTDLISTLLNSIYTKLLQTDTHGPKRKHTLSSKIYPIFVLHCICPPSEYDILAEPDKTRPFFRDEDAVKALVVGMMKACFQVDMFAIVFPSSSYDGRAGKSVSIVGESPLTSTVAIPTPPTRPHSQPTSLPTISPYRVLSSQALLQEASANLNSLFEEGFGGVEDIRQLGVERLESGVGRGMKCITPVRSVLPLHPTRAPSTVKTLSNDALSGVLNSQERIGVRICRAPLPVCGFSTEGDIAINETDAAAVLEPAVERYGYEEVKYTSSPSLESDLFDDHSFESLEPEKLAFLEQFRSTYSGAKEVEGFGVKAERLVVGDESSLATLSAHFMSTIEETQCFVAAEKRSKLVRSSHIMSSKKLGNKDDIQVLNQPVPSYPPPTHYKSLQLNKQQLGDIQYITQWDDKFLLGYDRVNKLLVAFDQHAVHERILFEKLANEMEVKRCQLAKPVLVIITGEEHVCFTHKQVSFEKYGFSYEVQPIDNKQKKRKKNVDDDNNEHISFMLEVTAVGSVLDEELTIPDLMDYCHDLMKSSLPDRMIKPSAIARILASKACRRAIKFNTALPKEQAAEMLAALSSTDMPFQCAHGRPSVVPLADLSEYDDVQAWWQD